MSDLGGGVETTDGFELVEQQEGEEFYDSVSKVASAATAIQEMAEVDIHVPSDSRGSALDSSLVEYARAVTV